MRFQFRILLHGFISHPRACSCLDLCLALDKHGHSGFIFSLGRGILLAPSEGDPAKHERLLRDA